MVNKRKPPAATNDDSQAEVLNIDGRAMDAMSTLPGDGSKRMEINEEAKTNRPDPHWRGLVQCLLLAGRWSKFSASEERAPLWARWGNSFEKWKIASYARVINT